MEEKNKAGFFKALICKLKNLLKNPKKLIPTFVLCAVWLVFSLMSAFGVNVPALRFFYTLTYANGGMFGGLFGALGGIFGKAVFAAAVNMIVLAVCEKRNPFKGTAKGMKGVFAGGLSAVSPLLIGGGLGVLLYCFFNVTSSPVNCAAAAAAAVGALSALGKRNGLLFSLIFGIMNKFPGGKTPSLTAVSRVITGFSLGFALSLPITFARLPLLTFILGILLTAAGILISLFVRKKPAAALLAVLIFVSCFPAAVSAAGDSYTIVIDPFFKENKETYGYHYTDWDQWMYYSFYRAGEIKISRGSDRKYSFTLPGYDYSYTDSDILYSVTVPTVEFTGDGFIKDPGSRTGYRAVFTAKLGDGISTDLVSVRSGKTKKYIHEMTSFELVLSFSTKDKQNGGLEVHSSGSRCVRRSYPEGTENPDTYTYWSQTASHFSQGFTLYGFKSGSSASDEKEEDDDVKYVPYRGRLSYSGGEENEYGQPLPDLMDFDGDGEITREDTDIRRELSYNPDYLDLPASPAAIVLTALITAIFGSISGAGAAAPASVGAAAGGALGAAAGEAAGGAAAGIGDLGPHISRDGDGDLNVTDPATGEQRLYKNNGDGTYTNPLTGAVYTEAELKASLESRAENAAAIRMDTAAAEEAISAQRDANRGLSQYAGQYAAEKAEEAAREEYMGRLGEKYNVSPYDEDALRQKIGAAQGKAEVETYEYQELEGELGNKQAYAETVEKAADTSIDVLADVTGRKDIKAGYTMLKNTAARTTEAYVNDKNVLVGAAQGAIEGGIGVVQDNVDGAGAKLAANVIGEVYKDAMDATINGKDMTEAVVGGIGKGLVNTGADVGMDLIGGGVKEAMGDAADAAIKNALTEGAEVTKGSLADGVKTLADDLVKDGLEEAFKAPGEE